MIYELSISAILVGAGTLGSLGTAIIGAYRARKKPSDPEITVRQGDELIELDADSVDPEELTMLLKMIDELRSSAAEVDETSTTSSDPDTVDPPPEPKGND